MFTPTKEAMESIRATLHKIMEGGDEEFAKAWIVYAELQLHTLNYPNKTILVTKVMPLIMACSAISEKSVDEIQEIIHNSVVRMLFQAKIDGRNSLEMSDARKAATYVREQCQT